MRGAPIAILCLAVALLATACGGGGDEESLLYVNPVNHAVEGAAQLAREGRADAAAMVRERIADQPSARWFTSDEPSLEHDVRDYVAAARAVGRVPVLVAYYIPSRDCGGYSGGGASSAAGYRSWIDRFATGIGDAPAIVILEPDALPHLVADCPSAVADDRYALIADAVSRLSAGSGTRVYVDAGNATWIDDPAVIAAALRRAGVREAAGFALNVANYETTADSIAYGNRVSDALGGDVSYVIDTSRNGNGATGEGGDHWCNPPSRRLGETPTLSTDHPRVDAFLWVKQPGDSDGECRGGPPAGAWWPQSALELLGIA